MRTSVKITQFGCEASFFEAFSGGDQNSGMDTVRIPVPVAGEEITCLYKYFHLAGLEWFALSFVEYVLNYTGIDQLCYFHRLGVADLERGQLAWACFYSLG
jgi:hypothetical protein